jgi:hypothetical protein
MTVLAGCDDGMTRPPKIDPHWAGDLLERMRGLTLYAAGSCLWNSDTWAEACVTDRRSNY